MVRGPGAVTVVIAGFGTIRVPMLRSRDHGGSAFVGWLVIQGYFIVDSRSVFKAIGIRLALSMHPDRLEVVGWTKDDDEANEKRFDFCCSLLPISSFAAVREREAT